MYDSVRVLAQGGATVPVVHPCAYTLARTAAKHLMTPFPVYRFWVFVLSSSCKRGTGGCARLRRELQLERCIEACTSSAQPKRIIRGYVVHVTPK